MKYVTYGVRCAGSNSRPLGSFVFDAFGMPTSADTNVWGSFCKVRGWHYIYYIKITDYRDYIKII